MTKCHGQPAQGGCCSRLACNWFLNHSFWLANCINNLHGCKIGKDTVPLSRVGRSTETTQSAKRSWVAAETSRRNCLVDCVCSAILEEAECETPACQEEIKSSRRANLTYTHQDRNYMVASLMTFFTLFNRFRFFSISNKMETQSATKHALTNDAKAFRYFLLNVEINKDKTKMCLVCPRHTPAETWAWKE